MRPEMFLADIERKPEALSALAASMGRENLWAATVIDRDSHLVLLGMGSSHYANGVAAARLRAFGVNAVAELASSDLMPQVQSNTVVVAVSASGGSVETLDAVSRYLGRCPVVAMTNVAASLVTREASAVLMMEAGKEESGVSCRSFQHTLALLLGLEEYLGLGPNPSMLVNRAAEATSDLLERRSSWLPRLLEEAIGPDGTYLVAPARRMSSAQQGALMLRETPRIPAVGCETGDWSHVDVYLTKTIDYRLVLFAGSRWEPQLVTWVADRGSRLISIGQDMSQASLTIRFAHDDDDDVRLLAEVAVTELLAESMWRGSGS
ncbi:MAG: SIS domain-containing protein [Actinobacteria bacterium]|nr:SIS domain-containing protein [Actinomycetota bacterium]